MRKIYMILPAAMLLFATGLASAQNLDPTVEVRRTYEGKLLEAHKPQLSMSVPDSLTRFDLDFDYSVFETPYKGSYEFNPYRLSMTPVQSVRRPGKFYLRAGAGYELHPELDLVWSPVQMDRLRLDIYANHRSFIGNYREMQPEEQGGGLKKLAYNGNKNFGYDCLSNAGADLRYDWLKGRLDFGAAYYGIAQNDWIRKREFNALDVNIGVSSKSEKEEYFLYDIKAAYRFADDRMNLESYARTNEHLIGVDARLGQVFGTSGNLLFDAGVNMAFYTGAAEASAGNFSLTPHYALSLGRWNFDLGVRVSAIIPLKEGELFQTRGQYVYPDVTLSVIAIPDAMKAYIHVGGGEKLNTLSAILRQDRHADLSWAKGVALLDNSIERVSATLGFEGRITSWFGYHLRGGYVNYKNMMLSGLHETKTEAGTLLLPYAGYCACQSAFASLDCNLNTESVDFNLSTTYNYTWMKEPVNGLLKPAAFQGEAGVTYNWKRRIFAGVDCGWSTARASDSTVVPGWADLGVNLEYVINRKISLWGRGGNLLNMSILRSPIYAEGGISGTIGICVNL